MAVPVREQVFIAARVVGGTQEPEVAEYSNGNLLARAMGVQPPHVMLYVDEGNRQVVMPATSERWVFDRCITAGTAGSTQFLLDVSKQLVNNALCGYNTALLSYGKYNMAEGAAEMDGLLRDFCVALFGTLGSPTEADSEWQLSVEAVEVHPQLGLHDLLAKTADKKGADLLLARNAGGGWYVQGLCARQLLTFPQLRTALHDATVNRVFVDPAMGIGNALVFLRVTRTVYGTYRACPNDNPQRCVTSCVRPVILLVDVVGTVPAAVQPSSGSPHGTGPFENLSQAMQELGGPRDAVASPLAKLLLDFLGGNAKTLLLTHVQADFPADRSGVRKALNCAVNCGSVLNLPAPVDDPGAAAIRALLHELGTQSPPAVADARRAASVALVAALQAVYEARLAATAAMKEREWAERKRRALASTSSVLRIQALDHKVGQCRQQEMKWLLTLKEKEEAVRECVRQRAARRSPPTVRRLSADHLVEGLELGKSPATSPLASSPNGAGATPRAVNAFKPVSPSANPLRPPPPSESLATSSNPHAAPTPSPLTAHNPLVPAPQRPRRGSASSPSGPPAPPPPPLPPRPRGLASAGFHRSRQRRRGGVGATAAGGERAADRSPRRRQKVDDVEAQTEELLWVPADIHQEIKGQLDLLRNEVLAMHMQHAEVETQCTHMMSQLSLARGHLHAALAAKKEECRRLQTFAEGLAQTSNHKKSRQDSVESLTSKCCQLEGERSQLQRQADTARQEHEQMRNHFIDFIRILKQDRRELYSLLREIRNQLSDKYVVPVSLSDVTAVERQDAAPSSSSVAVPSEPASSSVGPPGPEALPSVDLLRTIDATLDRIASHTHVPFLQSTLFTTLSAELDLPDRRSPSQGTSAAHRLTAPPRTTSSPTLGSDGRPAGDSPPRPLFTPQRRLSGSSATPGGGTNWEPGSSSSSRTPAAATPSPALQQPPPLTLEQLEAMGYSGDAIAQLKKDGFLLKFPDLVFRFLQRFEQNRSPPPPPAASEAAAALSGSDSQEEEPHPHRPATQPPAVEDSPPGGLSVTAAETAPDALHPSHTAPRSPVSHSSNGTSLRSPNGTRTQPGRELPRPGTKAHFEQLLEQQLLSDKDDWVCILEVCDVVHKMNTARELLNALKEPIKRNGLSKRQMRALTILKYCVDNCGFYLFEDLASRKWLQRLVKVALASQLEVRNYIARLLVAWSERWATFMNKAQGADFADAIKRLSAVK